MRRILLSLGFALRTFFLAFSLLFLIARTRGLLSFRSISAVVWLKCHCILLMQRADIAPDDQRVSYVCSFRASYH